MKHLLIFCRGGDDHGGHHLYVVEGKGEVIGARGGRAKG
jgi:hypothetical protein